MNKEKFLKPEKRMHVDPVTFFNNFCTEELINRWNKSKKHSESFNIRDYKCEQSGKELIVIDNNKWQFNDTTFKLPTGELLNNFQVFFLYFHNGSYLSAIYEIMYQSMKIENPYIRVGSDYFKKITTKDTTGISGSELKAWKKEEIKTDHGAAIFEIIPKYDKFIIEPDNVNFKEIITHNKCLMYNLYSKFRHEAKLGKWEWTEILLKHVFEEHYNLGLIYMKVLYQYPKQMLPILVLTSKVRATGKTTFINWLNVLFGDNMVNINPEDLTSTFNAIYAKSNIIAIEETMLDKVASIEKLKAITTAKFLTINQKHVSQYKVDFFGKVIISTNNETTFARVDDEETRFWIRRLKTIPKEYENHNIFENLVNEIPAFLYFLQSIPDVDFSKSRHVFTPEEIRTASLDEVKKESKPALYKDIRISITDNFLMNDDLNEFYATPTDIKNKWFANNNSYGKAYIKDILINHFNKKPLEFQKRYYPFGETSLNQSNGFPYHFIRTDFVKDSTKNEIVFDDEKPPF